MLNLNLCTCCAWLDSTVKEHTYLDRYLFRVCNQCDKGLSKAFGYTPKDRKPRPGITMELPKEYRTHTTRS